MKIGFAGGGTGGHFYPLIAIAEAISDTARAEHLLRPSLYYFAPEMYDEQSLFENEISFVRIPAGKVRRYRSLLNATDTLVTLWGTLKALFALFRIYPDVIISKGGYASVPITVAARVLGIPVIIHESDAKPGRANLLAAKWAEKIAISFAGAQKYFPKEVQGKIARTGIPIRKELAHLEPDGAQQYLALDPAVPTILILGGSSGSVRINETVIAALPGLVAVANVIHQTGKANIKNVASFSRVALEKDQNALRYHPVDYLNALALRRAAGAAALVISRAGSTAIAEVALWEKPAILIPIPEDVSHDQRLNAYAYAETGAAVVIEETNLTPNLLVSEVKRVVGDPALASKMAASAKGFTDTDAATLIAKEALAIGLSHES